MEDEDGIPHRRPAGASPVDRALHAVETAALALAMLAIVFAALVIFLTVTGRTFVGRSVPDSVILAENLMPIIVTLPLAYVAARRGHIEVEVFTNFLPPRGVLVLNMFGNLVGLIVFGLIAWSAWNVLGRDWATGRFYEGVLRIPQWPAKAFFVAGLALFGLRLVLNFVEDAIRLVRRDRAA
jgi:TRAP-type C4-dicarboxylate transport system permease small subunit